MVTLQINVDLHLRQYIFTLFSVPGDDLSLLAEVVIQNCGARLSAYK